MNEIPVVRHFVACLEIIPLPGGRGVTLRDMIHVIVRLPGEPFPCKREKMALFALLTNGRGEHDFDLELTRFDRGAEQLVSPPVRLGRLNLGHDPTVVHGLPIPLKNVVFPEAGQYAFYLICDGQPIADEKILVR
jgi:hypothetical protein